ncbi:MAG TPA: hypothetical protein VIM55_10355 [Mucilaginibacter sp.]
MQELRQIFSQRTIRFNNWSKLVDWRSFKNRGKQETSFGDIALIVNIQFSSGETLKGVACLEAKRDFDSENFESIDLSQLERIHGNAPYAHVLLYTHQAERLQKKFPDGDTWRSHFWVTPVNTAKPLLQQLQPGDNRNVLRTAFPFTMFLTARIFWGLDLDFRQEVLTDIESGINRIIDPAYLGIVNVYYSHQRPVDVALADIWQEI